MKKPDFFFLLIQSLTYFLHLSSFLPTIIAKKAGFFSPSGTIANCGYFITNLLASVELVILPSALPASTSWKSLAGASTEFNFDLGPTYFELDLNQELSNIELGNPNQKELEKAIDYLKKGDKEALLIMAKFTKVLSQRLFDTQMKLAMVDKDNSFPGPYIVAKNELIDAYIDALSN